jgi:DNA (cytosine-5)-methyltransferase 1
LNHLDLFSGIGGFSLGLKRVFNIKHSYFSEIDKYAIDVYKHNFKNSTYVKSVTDIRGGDLPRIDVITFGSPCQDFSLAGKRKGMDGERSSLITEAIRLIKECRPSFFIWENVKGTFSSNSGEDFWAIIQAFTNIGGYRLEWQLLNTKWFLPQNRERIYLVGCLGEGSGKQIFPITENNRKIDETRANPNTCTLTTRYKASTSQGSYIAECNKVSQEETSVIGYTRDSKGKVTKRNLKQEANTLHSASGGGGNTDQYIIKAVQIGNSETFGNYEREGDAFTLRASNPNGVRYNNKIRRLTPIECERLQGFPDNWTKHGKELGEISDNQRYKMCGNAVTVDVVEAVAKKIKESFTSKI